MREDRRIAMTYWQTVRKLGPTFHYCNSVVFAIAVTCDVILYGQPSLDLIVQEIALVKKENDLGLG